MCVNCSSHSESYLGLIVQDFNRWRLVIVLAFDPIQHSLILKHSCFSCHFFEDIFTFKKGKRGKREEELEQFTLTAIYRASITLKFKGRVGQQTAAPVLSLRS